MLDIVQRSYVEKFVNSQINTLLLVAGNKVTTVKLALSYLIEPSLKDIHTKNDGYRILELVGVDLINAYKEPSLMYSGITSDDEAKEAKQYLIALLRAWIRKPSSNFEDVVKNAKSAENYSSVNNPYLFVSTLNGDITPLNVSAGDTLNEVKEKYEQETGVSVNATGHIFRCFGKTLEDSKRYLI